jgi:hypothetical protein
MNTLKKMTLVFGMSVMIGGSLFAVMAPSLASATTPKPSPTPPTATTCSQNFLTFPTWFRGLVDVNKTTNECEIIPPKSGQLGTFITHIALNVIEMAMQAVGYLTAGFILWGGFTFLTSEGNPDAIAKARKTIVNAVVGLAISIASIAVINLISGILIYNP